MKGLGFLDLGFLGVAFSFLGVQGFGVQGFWSSGYRVHPLTYWVLVRQFALKVPFSGRRPIRPFEIPVNNSYETIEFHKPQALNHRGVSEK